MALLILRLNLDPLAVQYNFMSKDIFFSSKLFYKLSVLRNWGKFLFLLDLISLLLFHFMQIFNIIQFHTWSFDKHQKTENWTSPVFKWCKVLWMFNVSIFTSHLTTRLNCGSLGFIKMDYIKGLRVLAKACAHMHNLMAYSWSIASD